MLRRWNIHKYQPKSEIAESAHLQNIPSRYASDRNSLTQVGPLCPPEMPDKPAGESYGTVQTDRLETMTDRSFSDTDGSSASWTYHQGEIIGIASGLVCAWLDARPEFQRRDAGQQALRPQCTDGSQISHTQVQDSHETSAVSRASDTQRANQLCRKHPAESMDPYDSDDDDQETHKKAPKKQKTSTEHIGKIWACPYCKHDPVTYSLENNCKCSTHLLNSISRLK